VIEFTYNCLSASVEQELSRSSSPILSPRATPVPMIQLQDLCKVFGTEDRAVVALSGVSLSVEAGQIFGVIGTSGAGKSTLIRCVNLLERPTSGQVIVGGRELTALNGLEIAEARREIGMIFQHSNLLNSRDVFGNIALPLELIGAPRSEIRTRVNELLNLVDLTDKRDAYPAQLSGGQRQRVTIARALATKPKVLLSDEATSALDPATTRSILDLLRNINRQLNLTILLITHEMDVVKSICDHVAILGEGRLIEQGSVREVFAHPQTVLARKFIRSTLQVDVPQDYLDRLSQAPGPGRHPLLRLELTGRSVGAPLISRLARLFNVEVGIVNSRTDYAGGAKFGALLVELFGEDPALRQAEDFLRENQVNVEVLGYVTSDDATAG
jgi:D-methionine transport system ATP-binding protein